jgi:hypothetical protein
VQTPETVPPVEAEVEVIEEISVVDTVDVAVDVVNDNWSPYCVPEALIA